MMNLFLQGSSTLWIILIMSFISIAMIIEKIIFLTSINLKQRKFLTKLQQDFVQQYDCKKFKDFIEDQILKKQLPFIGTMEFIVKNHNNTKQSLEKSLTLLVQKEVQSLEKGLTTLATIASIAPLMGLLGTVLGMIEAFTFNFSSTKLGTEVITGLSKALITTASGLIVAIPCIVFYNYFSKKIDLIANELETNSLEMINRLK